MRTSECSPTSAPRRMLPCLRRTACTSAPAWSADRCCHIDDLSRDTADVAVRLLNGAAPKSISVPLQQPGPPTFDWRELQRWGIPESRLPPGSVVRYRAPSLWSAYRGTVLSAVGVLAVQSLLIVGLLYQRRARQRAEIESRRNLALAADASRRQTMSALTNSIAHELGQPLSAMIQNAKAGRMMITANRATADTMGEILSDIESQGVQATQIIDRHRTMLRSHQMDKKPIDLHGVIQESLALVAHDMRARQIEAIVELSSSPCIITGDQVLLQQVLVNLVVNAMDAMAETPPARRRVTIRTEVRAADVESRCATLERVCRRRSTARCSRHSSRRKRTASGSASRSREPSSTRMVAPSMPTTIPTAARHSRSRCAAAKRPRSCRVRRVPHDIPGSQRPAC